MPMMITGLKGPDRAVSRELARRVQTASAGLRSWGVQPVSRIRDQGLPNCAGEASGGRWHGLTGFDASGRDIWREAQRQESWQTKGVSEFDPESGAYLEYVVDGILRRGLTPYRPGEENDTSSDLELWTEGYSAAQRRPVGADAYRVEPGDLDALRAAILRGYAVFDGGGVTSKFMQRTAKDADRPAGYDELGGDRNGHAQGIFAFWFGSPVGDVLYYQGSWGSQFAGCYVPIFGADGTVQSMVWRPGCFMAEAVTFGGRWDCWALEPK